MGETIEVDEEYLRALETLAMSRISSESDVTRSEEKEVSQIVNDSSEQPGGPSTEDRLW